MLSYGRFSDVYKGKYLRTGQAVSPSPFFGPSMPHTCPRVDTKIAVKVVRPIVLFGYEIIEEVDGSIRYKRNKKTLEVY